MTTRRQFIEGAMLSGAAAASAAATAPAVTGLLGLHRDIGSRLPLARVIVDERFAAARIFAQEAQRQHAPTSSIDGSVHNLWYNDLFYRWREAKSPVAGMTNFRALFLLEMMAADAGMRVVHRIHHHESNGVYTHRVFGPFADRQPFPSRTAAGSTAWARRSAQIVTSWPSAPTPIAPRHSDILSAPLQSLDSRTLISWLMR